MPKIEETTTGGIFSDPRTRPIMKSSTPTLTNRGAAGLLTKVGQGLTSNVDRTKILVATAATLEGGINNITEGLLPLAVPIDSLIPDPMNARLHGDKNKDAIMASLKKYGQTKPVVVNKRTNIIVAGNGTTECAKQLGWTMIAANFVDMNDLEAAEYGITDNRTAELAAWDLKVMGALDKMLAEAGHARIGWTADELEVLRATEWTASDTHLIPEATAENEEAVPKMQEGDGELLDRLQVTIAEPNTQCVAGQIWFLGPHLLVIADVVRDVPIWRELLTDEMLFVPYPGPMAPLGTIAQEKVLLMVQSDPYIAGHIIDHYIEIYGEKEVSIASN